MSSSITQTMLVWGGAGIAFGLLLGSLLREDDGNVKGLGAPIRRPSPAQVAAQQRAVVNALRARAARSNGSIRPNIMTVADAMRAQQLDAYGDSAVYSGFDRRFPRFPATLQGRY